jgi:hypothetical protein
MNVKKLKVSPKRFASLVKRLAKMRPGTAVAKKVRAASQSELAGIMKTGGKAAAERAIRGVKIGAKRLDKLERKGTLRKWRTPIALGLTAVEIWLLATRARTSVTVKHKVSRPAQKRARAR